MQQKEEELDYETKEFKKHFDNALSVWNGRVDYLSQLGYEMRVKMLITNLKKQVIKIILSESAIKYIINHRKVKGKVIDLVSPCFPKGIFQMVGKDNEELAKIVETESAVYTKGVHGMAYVFGILSSFYEKTLRRWERRRKKIMDDQKRKKAEYIKNGKEKLGKQADEFLNLLPASIKAKLVALFYAKKEQFFIANIETNFFKTIFNGNSFVVAGSMFEAVCKEVGDGLSMQCKVLKPRNGSKRKVAVAVKISFQTNCPEKKFNEEFKKVSGLIRYLLPGGAE